MGSTSEADTSQDEREVDAIRTALDAGVTQIGTAKSYGNGHAEELLARAADGFDRKKLLVATKVSGPNR